MGGDSVNKMNELKAKMEAAARLERERLEKEEIERKERERKAQAEKAERERIAEEERLERERIAEEERLENERKLAEANRQSEEATRIELARQEEERRAREKEEAERKAREESERRAREEAERIAREASKKAEKDKIDMLVKQYQDRFNELQNMQISQNNIDKIKLKYKNLKQDLESSDTLQSLIDGTKLTIINGIIDIIKEGIEKTVGFIKNQPEYNDIFSDIMFIMTSFNSKDLNQQNEIINDVLRDDPINNKLFNSINSIYAELKSKFPKFVEFIDNDNYIIDDYSNIIQYMRDITSKNIGELQHKLSDLYEIIVGTARVAVRCKPKKSDNTTSGVKHQSFREYFDILLQGMQFGGGSIVQTGGYKYADIFTVNNNRIKISTDCGDTKDFVNGYGPFYSVYPPQYNNFHIYYNMFGLNKYNFPVSSNDNNIIEKYDKLLENNNLPKLKDNRTFDASGIKNKSHNLMQKLEKGGSVVIFGYGFSGSGKTYALIEGLTSNEHYDPSILEQFIKENSTSIKSVEFLELYPLGISHNPHTALTDTKKIISVKNNSSFETDEERDKVTEESIDDITFMKYANECGLTMTSIDNPKNLYNSIDRNISYDNISNRIRLLERHRFSKLRILATPNNDKSSRSFLQITIKLNDVTINGKTKTPKLVLFDMPGTENTVRIKTQFLGEELFSKLKESMNTNIVPEPKFAIYDPGTVGNNVKYIKSKYNENLPQFYSYTKTSNSDTKKQLEIIFKNFIMQKTVFSAINVFIQYDEIIAEDSLELALFINGLDIERIPPKPNENPDITIMYNKIPNETINFLTEELYIRIVNNFIKFIIDKDDKDKNKYFAVDLPTENCKISSDLTSEDYVNIEKIFNVKIDQTNTNGLGNSKTTFIHFVHNPISVKNNNDDFTHNLYDLTDLFDTNIDNKIKNEDIFKNTKGTRVEKINLPDLKNADDMGRYKKIFFANPLIKYIYLILNYLYRQCYTTNLQSLRSKLSKNPEILHALPQLFYRSATFFIYKYINFIVNQGRSIVTNLEHLKFFFLTRTGAIKKYNSDYPTQSFICNEANCNDLINSSLLNKKEYTKPTKIGKPQRFDEAKQKLVGIAQTEIQERINFGNMDVYGLIDILQKLSSSPRLKDCDTTGNTLNLLKSKANSEDTMSTITISKKDSLLGAIFIMFANYKIFLDNEIDSQDITVAKNKLDTLCKAAIDTANFTQSISSTSVNQKNTAMIEAPKIGSKPFNEIDEFKIQLAQTAVGGKRKFNMNQLLEHKNKKPRTHRNLSSKNKKSKVFYNRTKKNT